LSKKEHSFLKFDREHVWHPYATMQDPVEVHHVVGASGIHIELASGQKLIDGMSSWWACIHGYNNEQINMALTRQLEKMSHVMFGGMTHDPAVLLAQKLLEITPEPLNKVFFSDSGSISVEVAIKMAYQYWHSKGNLKKKKLMTIRHGYHGDTFGAMSVCDPHTGMHGIWQGVLQNQIFIDAPPMGYNSPLDPRWVKNCNHALEQNHSEIAAIILEPVVQGAGGMRIYAPAYLKTLRELCDTWNVLLIFDEIATGFGRTGALFGCNHAAVTPDIMCLGKAMTGGYMTQAATLCTEKVSDGISAGTQPVLMHGPTFMANPLACAASIASISALCAMNWQEKVASIERVLKEYLEPARALPTVSDVRVLGAIGVLELTGSVNMTAIQRLVLETGVWLRPFGRLVYTMPPFIAPPEDITKIAQAMIAIASDEGVFLDVN